MGRVKVKKNHTKSLIIPGIFLTFLSKFSRVSILHFISRNRQALKNNDQYQSKSSQVRENIEVYSLSVSCCLWSTSRCHMHLPMCWLLQGRAQKHRKLTNKMLSQDIQRIGSTARPWIRQQSPLYRFLLIPKSAILMVQFLPTKQFRVARSR